MLKARCARLHHPACAPEALAGDIEGRRYAVLWVRYPGDGIEYFPQPGVNLREVWLSLFEGVGFRPHNMPLARRAARYCMAHSTNAKITLPSTRRTVMGSMSDRLSGKVTTAGP